MKTIYDPRYVRMIVHLKRRRKALGMTQAMVANQIGVRRNWLTKVESCERRLDLLETITLIQIYRLDIVQVQDILTHQGAK